MSKPNPKPIIPRSFSYQGTIVVLLCVVLMGYYFFIFRDAVKAKLKAQESEIDVSSKIIVDK